MLIESTLVAEQSSQEPERRNALVDLLVRDIAANCRVNSRLCGAKPLKEDITDLESLRDFHEWLMWLGKELSDNDMRLVLRFRSFHRIWFSPKYNTQYRNSNGTSGELAELFYIIGTNTQSS